MNKSDIISILKELPDDRMTCSCDNENCKNCESHYEMMKEAIALEYAILYLKNN